MNDHRNDNGRILALWKVCGHHATQPFTAARFPGALTPAGQFLPGDFVTHINRLSLLGADGFTPVKSRLCQPRNLSGARHKFLVHHGGAGSHHLWHSVTEFPALTDAKPALRRVRRRLRQSNGLRLTHSPRAKSDGNTVPTLEHTPVNFAHARIEGYRNTITLDQLMLLNSVQCHGGQGRNGDNRKVEPPRHTLDYASGNPQAGKRTGATGKCQGIKVTRG